MTRLRLDGLNSFTSDTQEFVVRAGPTGTVIMPRVCHHRGGPLNLGEFDGNAVVCPWHRTRTRCPRPGSRRAPFVFVRSGREVTLVGSPAVERIYRTTVLEK
ncbi:Rieske 2Fe-2S domain-containing protein [Kineosporia sp. J2-2]|uniref:Rieske 2Fe-2S domain-containing protein n=1 Tax=Kineosporia corallincola TaxID=2835133 RepID=A0ABS5TP84_9ACTN|nr:Rieske 2Fe-2S domain-containing protein [Kineosporia corallincola]MBT0772920.1 Rieske 2Fe-2S domain-containing protein [Kineosporia corallincola]